MSHTKFTAVPMCDNVDQFGQKCHLHKGHVGNHRRAPAQGEPPVTDDLVRRLREECRGDIADAIAALRAENERQAREIARMGRVATGYEDRIRAAYEQAQRDWQRAERAEAERDGNMRALLDAGAALLEAEAERDALREATKTADAYFDYLESPAKWKGFNSERLRSEYRAARAKVGKK